MTVQYKSEHFTRNCMCFRDKGKCVTCQCWYLVRVALRNKP